MSRLSPLQSIERTQWIILAILSLGSLIFWDEGITAGVILGGLLVIVNFKVLRRIIEKGFSTEGPHASAVIKYGVKFFGLLAAVAVVAFFLRDIINLLGFLVGCLTIFLAITVEGMRGLRSISEEDNG